MSDLLIKILIVVGGGVAVVTIASGVGAALVATATQQRVPNGPSTAGWLRLTS